MTPTERAPSTTEAQAGRPVALVVPGDPDQPTGGYRYDARITEALRGFGCKVNVFGLPGRFPDADDEARRALDECLAARADESIVIIDGLALGGLPEIAERHADRLALVALVHHPLADETGLDEALRARFERFEARALAACRRIVTTSRFTARRVEAMGLAPGKIGTVEPGVEPADSAGDPVRAAERRRQRLLCIGSLTPRKGQDVLIDALAGLTEHDWRLELVGDPARDPEYAFRLDQRIVELGLTDRVRRLGACSSQALDRVYRSADLVIVPSHYEGYGMVVTEALARGLPIIATSGGALADTVPDRGALRVPPGDSAAMAAALARWLERPELRLELVRGALAVRGQLADWGMAGRRFAGELGRVGRAA